MPGKNGRELAHLVRAASPDTKVLFMSGYTEDALSSCGAREPGISFLEKPFTPGTLAHAVRSTLDALLPATILVADDEEGVRSFLRSVLEKAGYVVIEAGDGNQALALLGHTRVDLVITDLAMPEKEGIETIQQLGRLPTPVKIIAMSGAFGPALLEAARNLGACASFSKPIHPNDLVATVSRVLRRG
jgi:CheY-like chemotaxis protein